MILRFWFCSTQAYNMFKSELGELWELSDESSEECGDSDEEEDQERKATRVLGPAMIDCSTSCEGSKRGLEECQPSVAKIATSLTSSIRVTSRDTRSATLSI
jgi:hypothetical protein